MDSRFQSGIRILFLSVELGFRIPSGIPDSLSCFQDSKAQDPGFLKQEFSRITESGLPCMGRLTSALKLLMLYANVLVTVICLSLSLCHL